jgi:hypothetical protein
VPKTTLKIRCPECGEVIQASVQDSYRDFLIFVCPKCKNNVVCYDNKVDVISDQCVKKLLSKKHLQCCGIVESSSSDTMEYGSGKELTSDSVVDLKILLETSQDVSDFIAKI